MPQTQRTPAAPFVREYTPQLLADGQTHSRAEIAAYVRQHAPGGAGFSEGAVSGALRAMTFGETPVCEALGRGQYRLVARPADLTTFSARVECALKRCEQLIDSVGAVNVGELTSAELLLAAKLSEVRETIAAVRVQLSL